MTEQRKILPQNLDGEVLKRIADALDRLAPPARGMIDFGSAVWSFNELDRSARMLNCGTGVSPMSGVV